MAKKKDWIIGWRWINGKENLGIESIVYPDMSLKEMYDKINGWNTDSAAFGEQGDAFYFLKGEAK